MPRTFNVPVEASTLRDIIDHAFIRETAIGLQRDFDRHFADDIGGANAMFGHCGADRFHVALADGEIHPDRIELIDGRELRRRIGADEFADRDEMLGHRAVERGIDAGVAIVDLRLLQIGFVLIDGGLVEIARRAGYRTKPASKPAARRASADG